MLRHNSLKSEDLEAQAWLELTLKNAHAGWVDGAGGWGGGGGWLYRVAYF